MLQKFELIEHYRYWNSYSFQSCHRKPWLRSCCFILIQILIYQQMIKKTTIKLPLICYNNSVFCCVIIACYITDIAT